MTQPWGGARRCGHLLLDQRLSLTFETVRPFFFSKTSSAPPALKGYLNISMDGEKKKKAA